MSKRSPLTRIFAPLLVALVVLAAGFLIVTWFPLRNARNEWRAGQYAEAIEHADHWSHMHMWPNQYHQMLAMAYLASDQARAARPHLEALRGRLLMFSIVPKDEVGAKLFAEGQYGSFLQYDQFVHERDEPPDAALYRAAAYGLDPDFLPQAFTVLESIDKSAVDPKKLAALQSSLEQRRSGKVPWVVDRNGKPVAMLNVASKNDVVPASSDFEEIVDASAGELTFGRQRDHIGVARDVETTLDPAVQHAAKEALGQYRGAFVAIDPRTNEVLAIVSNDPKGPPANHALETQYEPGSVVKILTGLNALSSGVDVASMFPYHCTGDLVIDGRHFGDWLPQGHGTLPDFDEALAESCNIFFADLGLRLGPDSLKKFMTTAGFDQQTDLGVFKVLLGRIGGDTFDRFETALLSIGLEHESVTALHVAMLASMMANRGVLTTPRLVRGRRSILGEEAEGPQVQFREQIAPRAAADKMIEAMVAVVNRPKGTGRRAAVEGVPLAMKTGTAGQRANGYQAVIMAFAPVDSPKIAFGIIAEHAGPAEFAGAKIAHDFLEQIRDRLK